MPRRVGHIKGIDRTNGIGVIQPVDATDDLVVGLGELRPTGGMVMEIGAVVSFRERFHERYRIAWGIEPTGSNVLPFRRRTKL